jgi:hypothetical protein
MEKFVCVPTTFPLRKSPDFYLIFTFLFDIFILCLFSLSGYVRRSLVFFLWFGRERKTRRSYVLFAHRRRPAGGAPSPGLISGFSGGKKKSQNKNFDDHITTI